MIKGTGPLSKARRDEVRNGILDFCIVAKTVRQISDEFEISGISAGAFLSSLVSKDLIRRIEPKNRKGPEKFIRTKRSVTI